MRDTKGALKQMFITPYIDEELVSIPIPSAYTLGSPIVSWVLDPVAMSPLISGNVIPLSYKNTWTFGVSGQNTSGGAVTVYFQINKNGVAYKTGNSSIINNNYFTITMIEGLNLLPYDVIDVYIWASVPLTVTYTMIANTPSHVDVGVKNFCDMTVKAMYFPNMLTLTGKANSSWSGSLFLYPTNNVNTAVSLGSNNTFTIGLYQGHPTLKMFVLQGNTTNITSLNTSPTGYPLVANCTYPSVLSYRELLI